ncbi:MAG: hypothetical protein NT118_04155 [Lentisphaerae bacterium]|nr:hypothetical protein [Lentisphaerota bacterium]
MLSPILRLCPPSCHAIASCEGGSFPATADSPYRRLALPWYPTNEEDATDAGKSPGAYYSAYIEYEKHRKVF